MEMPKDKILSQGAVRPFDRLMVLSEAEAQAHRPERSRRTDFVQKSEEHITLNFHSQLFRPSARYKIIKDLGEGGIGRVYKAYDLWKRKDIALKILTNEKENRLFWEGFKNEFLLLTQLRHPGVVEVFDFGYLKPSGCEKSRDETTHLDPIQGEVPYFTMEFVEGKSLHESFGLSNSKDSISLQSEKLYHFLWQICDILEYIHLRGIVHCDLKPDNLKVTERVYNLKLLDFGLSEVIGTKKEKTTKGTLHYMAPEIFLNKSIDERTDLYSLGVILYELVTSKLPFFSEDPIKIVSGHLEQLPVPPKDLNPRVDEPLNQFILNLLEKSPNQRPQSASEVKEFVASHLKGNFEITERKTFISHLYSGEQVAREEEETQVGQLLKETVSSGGRGILLAGEQGAGKSFFLENLKIRCQLQGILYVDSNCLEDQTKAYQPLIEIFYKLEPYLEDHDSGLPRGADFAKEKFNQALKSILQKPRGKAVSDHQEQSSTHQRIIEALLEISRIVPLVLVIDNLQWADFQTITFLSQFGQNIEKSKILLACAFRPEEIKGKTPLKELIDGWRERGWCKHIKLDRFNYQKTKMFVRSKFKREKFTEGFFSYLYQNTSGNPFFLTEVFKYLLEEKSVFLKDCYWQVDSERLERTIVPQSVEAVLLKNLERYDQKTLDLLNLVAVMGKKFDPGLVEKLNLFSEKDLSKILFTLTKDLVFIKRESPLRGQFYFEFTNQSLQSLLYQKFDEKEKVKLHAKIAKRLEEKGVEEDEEAVFEIEHHYLKSHQHEKTYQYAILSAEKMTQRFANQEVLEYLGTAIEATSKFKDKEEGARKKVESLMRRADFHKQIGELNQALRDYKTILILAKNSPDLKMIAEAYNDLGDTYRLKHDYKKGLSCLKKALEIRQKLGDPLRIANTLHNMAIIYTIDSQYQKALSAYESALNIYKSLDNKFYIASTMNGIGELHRICHRYEQAKNFLREALRIKKELGNQEEIARGLNNLGATHFDLGEYDQAIINYHESLKLNEKIKNRKEMTFNLENLGEAYRNIGDYQNALKYSQKGLELASEIDFTERVGRIVKELGITYLELGEYQKAHEHLYQAKTIAEKIQDKELQILVLINLSRLFMTLNHHQKTEELLEEATQIINLISDERSLISVYQIKSRLSQKEEKFEEALKFLEQAMDLAKKLNYQVELCSLSLDYCEVFLGLKEVEKTEEYLNLASRLIRDESARYLLLGPRFYINSGRADWLNGNLNQAQRDFQIALDKAQKLNEPELLWQIHHLLGKLFLSKHEFEKAYNELQKAGKIVKSLSENMKDEQLKSNYLEEQRKKDLLSDLKNAAQVLLGNFEI